MYCVFKTLDIPKLLLLMYIATQHVCRSTVLGDSSFDIDDARHTNAINNTIGLKPVLTSGLPIHPAVGSFT